MGGDHIFDRVSEHLGIGHDETTEDGKVTLERIECNAACDFAPVVMTNWEFFDNQTPESTMQLVDDLRAGKDVEPTRGPTGSAPSRRSPGCSPVSRTDSPTRARVPVRHHCVGLRIAKEHGWVAPRQAAGATASQRLAATDGKDGSK